MQKEKGCVVECLDCPSFSAYSSNTLNHIADHVTRNDDRLAKNDNDFEFVAFRNIADGVFPHAAFPIFDRGFLAAAPESCGGGRISGEEDDAAAIQITLRKPLIYDTPSCSSSEVEDELENVPLGTYCVWTPKTVSTTCRKSKSTGSSSSKRWKLLDLLRRSNSEGKESVVFSTPLSAKKKGGNEETGKKIPASGGGREKRIPEVSAHEELYVRNREMRREDKRRSYLPYRKDLVGFCVNLNAMGKASPFHF